MEKRKSDEALIRKVNQIAEYFESQPSGVHESIAYHVNDTWTARQRMRLVEMIKARDPDLRESVIETKSLILPPRGQVAEEAAKA